MKTLFLIPVIILAMFLVACADDDDNGDTDTANTPAAEATEDQENGDGADAEASPTGEPDGLAYVLDTVGEEMSEDELRSHLSPELEDISEDEIGDVLLCFPTSVTATVVDTEIERNGEEATMNVTWEVTGAGAADVEQTIEHTWTFERVGGEAGEEDTGYLITGMPEECPHLLEDLEEG